MEISGKDLKEALRLAGLTQHEAAEKLGIVRQTLINWFNSGEIPPKIVQKVQQDLAIDFDNLPIKSNSGILQHYNIPKTNTIIIGEINSPDGESPFYDIGNGQYIMVVPVVPIKAQAGYIQHYDDEQYIEENFTQKHSFAVSRVYRGKYMAFIIEGDSMDNGSSESIIEGSTVTGREIQKQHWRNKFHIHRYKDYVIVHKDGIFTKRITVHDIEAGTITCHSLNENKDLYADFDLSLDECLQILNIVNVTQPR